MEGESLLNDATAISLFQVFFAMVKDLHPSKLGADEPLSILEQLGSVAGQIVWLAVGMPGSTPRQKRHTCLLLRKHLEGSLCSCLMFAACPRSTTVCGTGLMEPVSGLNGNTQCTACLKLLRYVGWLH